MLPCGDRTFLPLARAITRLAQSDPITRPLKAVKPLHYQQLPSPLGEEAIVLLRMGVAKRPQKTFHVRNELTKTESYERFSVV